MGSCVRRSTATRSLESKRLLTLLRGAAWAWLVAIPHVALAQNLIPNPGFESYDSIPYSGGQLRFCTDWNDPCITLGMDRGTPDYLRTDSPENGGYDVSAPTTTPAFAYPHGGQGMIGLVIHHETPGFMFREYARAELAQPLSPGARYLVRFHITNGGAPCRYARASARFSFLLSTDAVMQWGSDRIHRQPQYSMAEIFYDTTWRAFEVPVLADSAYRYITFGNFRTDYGTEDSLVDHGQQGDLAYVFVDDVSLVRHVEAGDDTTVCLSSPLTLEATGGYSGTYWWEYPPGDTLGVGASVMVVPVSDMTVVLHEGTYTDTLQVHVVAPPVVDLGPDIAICDPSVDVGVPLPGVTYAWSTGSTAPTITVGSAGLYWVDASNGPCTVRDSILVRFDRPLVDLGPDRERCVGDTLRLDAGHPGALHHWSTGHDGQELTVSASGIFMVEVDQAGCVGTDTVQVMFDPGPSTAMVPNVFTPNGDGVNDRFQAELPVTTTSQDFLLQVWDRWGAELFRGTSSGEAWDGRAPVGEEAPAGVYFYRLRTLGPCGRAEGSGTLTLLR